MMEREIISIASVASGSAVVRGGLDSRAVMVGDLDGSGRLPMNLVHVGAPPSGDLSALRTGDVVISLRGNSNNAASVVPADLDGATLFATLDLGIIRLNDPLCVSPQFVATWLNLPTTQALLAESREGTAAKRLPLGPLKALRIPLPDWSRQMAIVELDRMAAEERRLSTRISILRSQYISQCLANAAGRIPEESRP